MPDAAKRTALESASQGHNMNSEASKDLPEVAVGADGWLFLIGGSNEPLRMIQDPEWFSPEISNSWIDCLSKRLMRAEKMGCQYAHLAVPEKVSVYTDKLPLPAPFIGRAPTRYLTNALKNYVNNGTAWRSWIDVLPYFISQREAGLDLYWKTDTHWNFIGAFSAYQMICSFFGVPSREELLHRPRSRGQLMLDLGAKMTPPLLEEFEVADVLSNSKIVFKNRLVQLKEEYNFENEPGFHHGSEIIFSNESEGADPRKILIFGDSFSEYRPHLLTGLLAETFKDTRFIWSSSIDWSVVEAYKPDIVLTEISERFMRIVPSDDYVHEVFSNQRADALEKLAVNKAS